MRKCVGIFILAFIFLFGGLGPTHFSSASMVQLPPAKSNFRTPLALKNPLKIRQDALGSGLFGTPRKGGRRHRGIDLIAPEGTQVLAAKSGRAYLGRKRNGMGRYVYVRHSDGWLTRYGHLDKIFIRNGQRVRCGQPLGTVSRSGNARWKIIQAHLHFEIWTPRRKPVDPWKILQRGNG